MTKALSKYLPFRILSIDGGGIRVIIPAVILAEIENITSKPISELFDLIAGTSTGGILSLGLCKPDTDDKPQFSAQDLVSLYENHGHHIFHKSWLRQIKTLHNLLDERYSSPGLKQLI